MLRKPIIKMLGDCVFPTNGEMHTKLVLHKRDHLVRQAARLNKHVTHQTRPNTPNQELVF